jgi:hypothetical protein
VFIGNEKGRLQAVVFITRADKLVFECACRRVEACLLLHLKIVQALSRLAQAERLFHAHPYQFDQTLAHVRLLKREM